MKTICVTHAGFDRTVLGTRSRLTELLAGVPVLRRSVQQMMRIDGVESVVVLVSEDRAPICRDMLRGTEAIIQPMRIEPPPWSGLVCASRKWSLDGWRGGVGGATVFDEFTDCRVLHALLDRIPADAVLSVPADAPLLNSELAGRMIEHRGAHRDEARLTFTQAVPGLAGIVLDVSLVRELAATNIPISWLFSYKPDDPSKDLIFQPACLDIPAPLRFAAGRLIADTDGAMSRLTKMLHDHESWNLDEIGRFLVEQDECGIADFPREVEVEIVTENPYPESLLVPRGKNLGRVGTMDASLVQKVAGELVQHDDLLCVLGGFGDPLRHPAFLRILELLRPRPDNHQDREGVFGLCVRTEGVDLTSEIQESLIAHGVEILNVCVDAWTEQTYRLIKGIAENKSEGLQQLYTRLESFSAIQHEQQSPIPIVVPEMIKARENVHELDAFFDGWLRRVGAVNIRGFTHFAGQRPDHEVINMQPPRRIPCRRLRSRCLILCDGRVALCDQDFKGVQTFGNVREASLAEIWQSAGFQEERHRHIQGQYGQNPLCAACTQWDGP